MDTPVLFLVFNRPDVTEQTFARIRIAQPRQLFIAADGPRGHAESDAAKCREVREIIGRIDWKCDARFLLRENNLGCGKAVGSAIDWFFEHVDRGIILEDDCWPSLDFFVYMEAVLARYSGVDRVMMASGCSFQNGARRTPHSYFFSRCCHMWGWGTWRSAWKKFDLEMKSYARFKAEAGLENILDDAPLAAYWYGLFDKIPRKEIDTWDIQWTYAVLSNNGLSAYPEANMISNIGFGAEGTHTRMENHPFSRIPIEAMGPLSHPESVFPNREADIFTARKVYRVGREASPQT